MLSHAHVLACMLLPACRRCRCLRRRRVADDVHAYVQGAPHLLPEGLRVLRSALASALDAPAAAPPLFDAVSPWEHYECEAGLWHEHSSGAWVASWDAALGTPLPPGTLVHACLCGRRWIRPPERLLDAFWLEPQARRATWIIVPLCLLSCCAAHATPLRKRFCPASCCGHPYTSRNARLPLVCSRRPSLAAGAAGHGEYTRCDPAAACHAWPSTAVSKEPRARGGRLFFCAASGRQCHVLNATRTACTDSSVSASGASELETWPRKHGQRGSLRCHQRSIWSPFVEVPCAAAARVLPTALIAARGSARQPRGQCVATQPPAFLSAHPPCHGWPWHTGRSAPRR